MADPQLPMGAGIFSREEVGRAVRELWPVPEFGLATDDEIADALQQEYPEFLTRIAPKVPQLPGGRGLPAPPTREQVLGIAAPQEPLPLGMVGPPQVPRSLTNRPQTLIPTEPDVVDMAAALGGEVVHGAGKMVTGTAKLLTPPPYSSGTEDLLGLAGAASDVIEGGMAALTPTLPVAAVMAPLTLASALSAGMFFQRLIEQRLREAGAPEEVSRLGGNVAAVGMGGWAGSAAHGFTSGRATGARLANERAFVEGKGAPDVQRVTEAALAAAEERLGAEAAADRLQRGARATAASFAVPSPGTRALPPARPTFIVYPSDATPVLEPTGRPGAPGVIAPGASSGQPATPLIDRFTGELESTLAQTAPQRPRLNTERGIQLTPEDAVPPTRTEVQGRLIPPGRKTRLQMLPPVTDADRIGVSDRIETAGRQPIEEPSAQPRLQTLPTEPPPRLIEPPPGEGIPGQPGRPGVAPQPRLFNLMRPIEQAGLRWVREELSEGQYQPRVWDWSPSALGSPLWGNAAGGHANILPSVASWPVYQDIQAVAGFVANGPEIRLAVHKGMEGIRPMTSREARLYEAAQRVGNAWQRREMGDPEWARIKSLEGMDLELNSPKLPASAGELRRVADEIAQNDPPDPLWDVLNPKLEEGAFLDEPGMTEPGMETRVTAAGEESAYRQTIAEHLSNGPEQLGLQQLGPGAAGGPPIRETTPISGEPQQPALPGIADVRTVEIPTPEVAEAPFSLTSEAAPPARPPQRSFFDRLRSDKGFLLFDVPKGDVTGIRTFLKRNEAKYGDQRWFVDAEEALSVGNADRAWRVLAVASARELAAAPVQALSKEERAWLKEWAFAEATGRTERVGSREVISAPPIRSGQQGIGVTVNPGGTLKPPPLRRPLPPAKDLPPNTTDSLLSQEAVRMVLEESDPELMYWVNDQNKSTFERAFRQVGEQAVEGVNTREIRQYLKSVEPFRALGPQRFDAAIAGHVVRTISAWGRGLGMVGNWVKSNLKAMNLLDESLEVLDRVAAAEHDLSAGAMQLNKDALRAQLKERMGPTPPERGALRAGRHILGVPGSINPNLTLDALAQGGSVLDRQLAGWAAGATLQAEVSAGRALIEASRSFILGKLSTASRNFTTQEMYYSARLIEDGLAAVFEAASGHPERAKASWIKAQELAKGGARSRSAIPVKPWETRLEAIFGITRELIDTLPASDVKRTLLMLNQAPVELGQFLGLMSGGEITPIRMTVRPLPTRAGKAVSRGLEKLIQPETRAYLTLLSREVEFFQRSLAYDAMVRAGLRNKGLDPDVILSQKHPEVAIARELGQQGFQDLIASATAHAMDLTFAGGIIRDSLPGSLIAFLNDHPYIRLGYEFPRFNLSSSARVLYDRSPAALLEWLVQMPRSYLAGEAKGRLARGILSQQIQETFLPELLYKKAEAKIQLGRAVYAQMAMTREAAIRLKQLQRARTRESSAKQLNLPGASSRIGQLEEQYQQAYQAREDARARYAEASQALTLLTAQEGHMRTQVAEARAVGAPNLAEHLARLSSGTLGLFGVMYALRSSPAAIGTAWNEIKDHTGRVINLRGFGPWIQTALLADIFVDLQRNVDWSAYRTTMGMDPDTGEFLTGLGSAIHPVDAYQTLIQHYQGKYTLPTISEEFVKAYLAVSQMAGTSKTFADFFMGSGDKDLIERFAQAAIGSLGQLINRFFVPLSMVKDVVGQFVPEEAIARIPSQISEDQPYGPVSAAIGNIPFVSRIMPPTISQTIGEAFGSEQSLRQAVAETISRGEGVPLRTIDPLVRELTGLSIRERDDVRSQLVMAGVPGSSAYLARSGDRGLDNVRAAVYAKLLNTYLPKATAAYDKFFQQRTGKGWADQTPAIQRDALQRVLPQLKRAADGLVMITLGAEVTKSARGNEAEARRRARWMAILKPILATYPPEEPTPESPDPAAPQP